MFLPVGMKMVKHIEPTVSQLKDLSNQNNQVNIVLPPEQEMNDVSAEMGKLIKECYQLFQTHQAIDEKGRYLYWDKIKHKYGKQAEKVWAATKINRLLMRKPLVLTEKYEFYFCIPDTMQALLHFIDKTSSHYNIQLINQKDKHILSMEEAITSAQMEGAATTRKIAKELITRRPDKPKNDYEKMVINNYHLMKKVVELKDEPLNIDLILDLHRTATRDVIENNAISGEFRQSDDFAIYDGENNLLHQPPPHEDVAELMNAFCDFANAEHDGFRQPEFIHPIVKAIILHFLMGYIHPFGDGNGRTARALFYWFMLKNGYALFEFVSISRLLQQANTSYGKSYVYTECDDLDMTYFIYFQLDKIKQAIDDFKQYVERENQARQNFTAQILDFVQQHGLDERQIEILKMAVAEKGKTFIAKELATQFKISENTARKLLKELADLKLLAPLKSGNAILFVAPADLVARLQK
ncbi:Fic family protein [Alysiella crassa]|nr:Fic family protein [Alysiella crassa]UOP06092.1 Fic family protein [Alysiella crassa]